MYTGYISVGVLESEGNKYSIFAGQPIELEKIGLSADDPEIRNKNLVPERICGEDGTMLRVTWNITGGEMEHCLEIVEEVSAFLQDLKIRCHWYLSSGSICSADLDFLGGKAVFFRDLSGPVERN